MRAGALPALLALAAMGCGDQLIVRSETHQLMPDERVVTLEMTCETVFWEDQGVSSSQFTAQGNMDGGSLGDVLEVHRQVVGREFRVTVRNGSSTLAAKGYGRRFLESGKLDRFTVTTFTGARYELLHRGGPDCESVGRIGDGSGR